jgi:hypothetical protein
MAATQDDARLVVSVRPARGPDDIPFVELAGTRDGLEWLAERILSIARAEPEQHLHLDEQVCGPVYQSDGGWWLTIVRVEALRGAPPLNPAS